MYNNSLSLFVLQVNVTVLTNHYYMYTAYFRLHLFQVKTICGSNDDPFLKNMYSISTAPDSRKLLIGTEAGLVCLSRNGDIIWTLPTNNVVCSVDSRRGLVYAAIEKEKRVFVVDQHGNMLVENVFPGGCTISRPSKVSVGKSSLIVREFTDHDTNGLKSMVHVFSLSF